MAMIQSNARVIRWAARLLSLGVLAFWGVMLIGHLVGDAGRPSRPLVWQDFSLLGGTLLALAGLALAWKWELGGALTTLGATAATAVINWRVLMFPGTLIPAAAILFLAAAISRRIPHSSTARGEPLV